MELATPAENIVADHVKESVFSIETGEAVHVRRISLGNVGKQLASDG